jgi:hypothetical protein
VLGVACTKDPGQSNLYVDLRNQINAKKIGPDQQLIVQNYLLPRLTASIGMQANVVDLAYRSLGYTAGSGDESQWERAFPTWRTYVVLVPRFGRTHRSWRRLRRRPRGARSVPLSFRLCSLP